MYILCCAAVGALVVSCFYLVLLQVLRQQEELVGRNTDSKSDISTARNSSPQYSGAKSQFYALVIGIDDYPNLQHLKGAVSDAESVTEFLTTDLGVPPCHITNLRNSAASRAGIINAFQRLRGNDEITPGSPILIYFAGHGGVGPATKDWQRRHGIVSKVQVIFPFDYDVECEGKRVNCIPDKTVARLLNELAQAKGNNITVIFDSCHSASGNRAVGERRARSAAVRLAIPVDIDDDILPPAPTSLATARHAEPPLCTHQSSHVYFAACGSDEQAWEESGRGKFTVALLTRIRACGVDKITYQNLMSELPCLSKQTPHCYGTHKSRILFNACVPSRKITYVPVLYDFACRTLTLQAGLASGVAEGSVWEVRDNATEGDGGIVGRAKAGVPSVSNADLRPEGQGVGWLWRRCEKGSCLEGGKSKLYARPIGSGPGNELKVWFSPEVKRLIFPELEDGTAREAVSRDHEVGYAVHPERDSADIAVGLYQPEGAGGKPHLGSEPAAAHERGMEPEVVFHLCNPQAAQYGVATLQQRKPARRAEVEAVLFAASRWNWHLRRTNLGLNLVEVGVEMFKIGKSCGNQWSFVKAQEQVHIDEMGVVDFKVHEQDLYAVRLRNQANIPLYVWVFYFDMTTFSIVELFGHSVSNSRADPVIPEHGEFVIGDGAEGDAPLRFRLDPDETIEVGYMKVFWSTDPLELDHLAQESAFDMKVGGRSRKVTQRRAQPVGEWGSVLLTLVQRAPGKT